MGRQAVPSCRLCRREGLKLYLKGDRCLTSKCSLSRRKKAPGMARGRRGKLSNFGLQLREKQKVKRYYGVAEKQFRKYYQMAARAQGNTGELLIQYLERRIDNIVYRLGFAVSRNQAKQMVAHGLITINGTKIKTSSILIKKGDVIKINEKKKEKTIVKENSERELTIVEWLEKTDDFSGKILELPNREDIQDIPMKEQLIIEHYSK